MAVARLVIEVMDAAGQLADDGREGRFDLDEVCTLEHAVPDSPFREHRGPLHRLVEGAAIAQHHQGAVTGVVKERGLHTPFMHAAQTVERKRRVCLRVGHKARPGRLSQEARAPSDQRRQGPGAQQNGSILAPEMAG